MKLYTVETEIKILAETEQEAAEAVLYMLSECDVQITCTPYCDKD